MTRKVAKTQASVGREALLTIGFATWGLVWLQAFALIVIAVLQYAVFDHIKPSGGSESSVGSISTVLSQLTLPVAGDSSNEPNMLLISLAWVVLVVTATTLIVYTGKMAAAVFHLLFKRLDARSRLTAKLATICLAIGIIVFVALVLPAAKYIVPLNLGLAALSTGLFCLHYVLTRSSKKASMI